MGSRAYGAQYGGINPGQTYDVSGVTFTGDWESVGELTIATIQAPAGLELNGNVDVIGALDVSGVASVGIMAYQKGTQVIDAAGDQITPNASCVKLNNTTAAPITLTSTPTITDGPVDGMLLILENLIGSGNIVLQDEGTLAGSNMRLASAANKTLGTRDLIGLLWDATSSEWRQIDTLQVL